MDMTEQRLPPDLPNVELHLLPAPRPDALGAGTNGHPPRILLLYGSLRPQSYSRKLALEAERILRHLGAETRVFDPHDLPVVDSVTRDHPKVQQLREWSLWSEGQVWVLLVRDRSDYLVDRYSERKGAVAAAQLLAAAGLDGGGGQ